MVHACCYRTAAAGGLFSRLAGVSRAVYATRGLDWLQRRMVQALRGADLAGATLLEIGCGVGYLHQELLEAGAGAALGIDLSERMIGAARHRAERRGLGPRVSYRVGDFVELAPGVEAHDVTVLDKVVCCYPDAAALIQAAADRTRRTIALIYPRDHAFNRALVAGGARLMRALRVPFRNYVHDPQRVADWIRSRGFRQAHEAHTAIWLMQVYVREGRGDPAGRHYSEGVSSPA